MNLQLLFIAVVLLATPLVWYLPKAIQGSVMLIATLGVLLYIAQLSVCLMLVVAVLQWLIWKQQQFRLNKFGLISTVLLPLLPLVTYKIGYETAHWLLPLGLSYYAFRQIHVAFECYKGQAAPTLKEYLQYLLFLPVMLIGPIHRLPEFQRSLRRNKWQPAFFSEGMERILYGLVKINFFGNYLFTSKAADWLQHMHPPLLKIYLQMMAFTGNAYMQFAGFSDLAIGAALLWGIRIIENFNYPFLATNMQEFWQRWHISLSSWCRDYVFQPILAASRNRWAALALSMLVLALWHEISARYILWGLFHASLVLLTVRLRKAAPSVSRFINQNPTGKWLGRLWVLHLFAISCLFIGAVNWSSYSFTQLFK